MLTKKELSKIRTRFENGGATNPLRIEGDHLKHEGQVIGLGWSVLGTSKMGDHEYTVSYANGTTFDAANFLVHLPVDMANMLEDLEYYHLVLEGVLAGHAEAIEQAKFLIAHKMEDK